jgi:hypothetical protein
LVAAGLGENGLTIKQKRRRSASKIQISACTLNLFLGWLTFDHPLVAKKSIIISS